ncbi:MAG TPA: prepilin-type N-terminal cleavage/methylation domain-containing protein [Campylobacter avium]|nr:type II secretion system protein [Campylobacter avium]HJE66521.1 prepilin-type N-terminal cleavage/methylation domain-containing protein [Campylobacter avium]
MRKAFTVLELIFVIVILGILAAIALPRFSSSKDEAEISKALSNLKTMISDFNTYALKNDELSSTGVMSSISAIENVDLNNISLKEVNFKVSNDDECLKLIFMNESNILAFGIASNDNVKNLIQNLIRLQNQAIDKAKDKSLQNQILSASNALMNADFTSTSSNKACVGLSKHESFKALANKTYILLGN